MTAQPAKGPKVRQLLYDVVFSSERTAGTEDHQVIDHELRVRVFARDVDDALAIAGPIASGFSNRQRLTRRVHPSTDPPYARLVPGLSRPPGFEFDAPPPVPPQDSRP